MDIAACRAAAGRRSKHALRGLRLVWHVTPGLTAAWAASLVIQGLLPVAFVYVTKHLVDRMVDLVGAGTSWTAVWPLLTLAGGMAGLLLVTELLQVTVGWLRTAQADVVQDHIRGLVHERSAALDIACYESADYHDRLHRARHEAAHRPLALLESSGAVLQGSVTLAGMASLVIPYGAWVPVALVASALPGAYAVIRNSRRHHHWWTKTTPLRRWTNYYDWLLTFSEFAAEIRQYDVGRHFAGVYQTLRRRLRRQRLRLLRRESAARLGANLAALTIGGGAIGWVVWRALAGTATLGDVVLFHQAFERGRKALRGWLGSAGQLYGHSLVVESLFELLDQTPTIVDPPVPKPLPSTPVRGIAFDGVTFRYPGIGRRALNGLSLTLKGGEIAALVGPNGAGKSTVLKLLCRFYDPLAGNITIDGIDLRDVRLSELRANLSVAFQEPVPYHATLHENIAAGDLANSPCRARVEAAAMAAGAAEIAQRLPNGYETLLSEWFAGGTQLSSGEWQRVALARALIRPAPIVLLDEPTSSMDPWAEAAWLDRLRDIVQGRTVLLITHRMSTALRADVVHVMQRGRVVRTVRPAATTEPSVAAVIEAALPSLPSIPSTESCAQH